MAHGGIAYSHKTVNIFEINAVFGEEAFNCPGNAIDNKGLELVQLFVIGACGNTAKDISAKTALGICEALGVNWLARVQIDKINGDGGCAYVNNKTVIFPCRVARFHSAKFVPDYHSGDLEVRIAQNRRQMAQYGCSRRLYAIKFRKHALNVGSLILQ